MEKSKINHVFGPVPSRRLGRSLGIDLVPYKVCSFDCIYCQLGRTTNKTIERKEYIPFDEIIHDLEHKLNENHPIDYITLAGSGEPTLYSRIDELVDYIKSRTRIPVAIITNGSLLWDPAVRDSLAAVDLAVPSLDAGNNETFRKINRPCDKLDFSAMVTGIRQFVREFKGETWLEIFLLDELNSSREQTGKLSELAKSINADRIQFNTVARPACENYARPLSKARMQEIITRFPTGTEIIADFSKSEKITVDSVSEDDIINLLRRRPCTSKDIADSLCLHYNETLKILEQLLRKKVIVAEEKNKVFYRIPTGNNQE